MERSPGVLELIGQAKNFVQDNFGYLWEMVKPLLVYILIFEFLAYFLGKYHEAGNIFSLPTLYFMACFALIWHRSVLQGPSSSHAVKPFELKDEDKPFLWLFFGLMVIPFLLVVGVGGLGGVLAAFSGPLGPVIIVGLIIFMIWLMIQIIRISFMLPAKSVNADTSIQKARELSKGLIWKLILAGIIVGLIYGITIGAYSFAAGFIVTALFGWMGQGPLFYVLEFAVLTPVIFASIILAAVNVTMLSKLYQWGVVHQSGEEAGR